MIHKYRRHLLAIAPLAALCCAAAWVEACGPDWLQLLPQRQRELRESIPLVLTEELKAITLPSPLDDATRKALAADAPKQAYEEFDPVRTPQRWLKAQQAGLSAADAQVFAKAREAKNGDGAEATAAQLAPAWRLYAAAAADVRMGYPDPARQRFEKLLALPADQARPMAVWAAYSLGRLLRDSDNAAAAQAFVSARRWRANGAPDPLGLAVDSLGEEARLSAPVDTSGQSQFDQVDAPAFVATLRLYFEQSRLGSLSGTNSLRQLRNEMVTPERLQRLLSEDWGQALLVRVLSDQGIWVDEAEAKQRYQGVVTVIAATPTARLAEPERWAALAWRHGDLKHARAWAGDTPRTTLGAWTRAKLALAQGDTELASKWFAAAVKAWPQGADTAQLQRLRAEQGLMQLQRGELPLGLRALMAAGDTYALDASFVAESLLTSAELRTVVDDIAPAASTDANAKRLRHLLARRLMREGQFADAVAYFPAHYQTSRWTPQGERTETLDLPALARQYADALSRADRAWTRVGRAGELMAAGHVARQYGMELMGFELGADGFATDGGFEMNGGQPMDKPVGKTETERLAQQQTTQPLPASEKGKLPRFHYRYVAAQHALQAADLLPARSQAFASSLCHAALWVGVRDEAFMDAMWTRYRREGARVSWAGEFGQACPEPELQGARRLQVRDDLRHALPWLHRHPRRSAAAAAALVAALAFAAVWAWRRWAPSPR